MINGLVIYGMKNDGMKNESMKIMVLSGDTGSSADTSEYPCKCLE
jgi:hypothetical protein